MKHYNSNSYKYFQHLCKFRKLFMTAKYQTRNRLSTHTIELKHTSISSSGRLFPHCLNSEEFFSYLQDIFLQYGKKWMVTCWLLCSLIDTVYILQFLLTLALQFLLPYPLFFVTIHLLNLIIKPHLWLTISWINL